MYYPNEFKEFINNSNLEALEALFNDNDQARACWAKAAYADVRSRMLLHTGDGDRRILINDFILYGEVLDAKLPDDIPGRDVLIQHCKLKQAELMLVRNPRLDASFTKKAAHELLKEVIKISLNAEIKHRAVYLIAQILLGGGKDLARNLITAMKLLDHLSNAEGVSPQLKAIVDGLITFQRGRAKEYALMTIVVPPPAPLQAPALPNVPAVPKFGPATNLPSNLSFAPGVALANLQRAQPQMLQPSMPPVARSFVASTNPALPGAQPLQFSAPALAAVPVPASAASAAPVATKPAAAKRKPADEGKNQGQAQKEARPKKEAPTSSSSASPALAPIHWVPAKPPAKRQPTEEQKQNQAAKKAHSDVQLKAPAASTAGMLRSLGSTAPVAVAPSANPPVVVTTANVPAAAEQPRNTFNTATADDHTLGILALAALSESALEEDEKSPTQQFRR
jgi:hypothetical protein